MGNWQRVVLVCTQLASIRLESTFNVFSVIINLSVLIFLLQLHFNRMISSFPPCVFRHPWKWPSPPIRALVMMKTMMFLRLSCLMKNYPQTPRPQRTFRNLLKGLTCQHLLAGSSSPGCINAPSVTNASSTTLCSSSTREFTVGCSLTTAPSVGGPSEQPLSWPVTG